MGKVTDKAAFLGRLTLKSEWVEWQGDEVEITELTASQRERMAKMLASEEAGGSRVNALVACMGTSVLSEEDIDSLMETTPDNYMELVDAICELSGIGEKADEDAKKS